MWATCPLSGISIIFCEVIKKRDLSPREINDVMSEIKRIYPDLGLIMVSQFLREIIIWQNMALNKKEKYRVKDLPSLCRGPIILELLNLIISQIIFATCWLGSHPCLGKMLLASCASLNYVKLGNWINLINYW